VTARARPWWQAVTAEADDPADPAEPAGSAGGREPWADRPVGAAALTPAQRAVLAGLDDQPDGPRLDDIAADGTGTGDQPGVPRLRPGRPPGDRLGNGTGNAPGDAEPPDPHTRTRWTQREQPEG
jgi:hypothetical protein